MNQGMISSPSVPAIEVSYQIFPTIVADTQTNQIASAVSSISGAVLWIVVFGLYARGIVSSLLMERESGAVHLQFVNGLRPVLMWVGHVSVRVKSAAVLVSVSCTVANFVLSLGIYGLTAPPTLSSFSFLLLPAACLSGAPPFGLLYYGQWIFSFILFIPVAAVLCLGLFLLGQSVSVTLILVVLLCNATLTPWLFCISYLFDTSTTALRYTRGIVMMTTYAVLILVVAVFLCLPNSTWALVHVLLAHPVAGLLFTLFKPAFVTFFPAAGNFQPVWSMLCKHCPGPFLSHCSAGWSQRQPCFSRNQDVYLFCFCRHYSLVLPPFTLLS